MEKNLQTIYNNEISLDIKDYSENLEFIEKVKRLGFLDQIKIIDMIERPYWISLIGHK